MTAKPNNGVSERQTFRYGLHRLWLRCGAAPYLAAREMAGVGEGRLQGFQAYIKELKKLVG